MQGEYVLTQRDVQEDRRKPDSVAIGTHYIEGHRVQRVVDEDGYVTNIGGLRVQRRVKRGKRRVHRYQIPYRSITPWKEECDNLLVPVCVSASHVAYSSLRMELQYMMLGESAGVAAALAAKKGQPVQDVDIKELQFILESHGQGLEL
jgi:hypothetical protein